MNWKPGISITAERLSARRRSFFPALLFTLGILGSLWLPVHAGPRQAPTAYEVIAAVNALRASYGLDPYLVDGLLMISAQGQADYLAGMSPGVVDGHTGPGGTDADQRAFNVGFPYVEGLDINENWASLPEDATIDTLIYEVWGDEIHMHTMLHDRGQLVGMGVAQAEGRYYYVLDVAAYWGDAGLTAQPTTLAYGEGAATQQYVSQYIAPVTKAKPGPDGSIVHTVQSGQSLYMLAQHYGVSIDDLRALNGLQASDMIYIGQKIIIRGPTPATQTPAQTAASPASSATSVPSVHPPATITAALATQSPSDTLAALGLENSLWFLIFFVLFAIGLLLVAAGTANR
jgi:LysM repeat protein